MNDGIFAMITGLIKPGKVDEILALYWLKSLSLDYKAKLKSPCFFSNNIINYQLLAIYKIFPTVFSIFVKLSQKCLDLVCKTKNKTLV
jgi:hypothetical protein